MKRIIALFMCAICLLAVGCSSSEPGTVEIIEVDAPANPVVTPAPVTVTPSPSPEPEYQFPGADKMAAAKAKNSHVVGWITVPGTVIDQPILFHPDVPDKLFYYLDRDIEGERSDYGSVTSFFDMANYEGHNISQNLVITAHNNRVTYYNGDKVNAMFHELHHIQAVNTGNEYCGYDENGRKCEVKLDPAVLPDLKTPEGRLWDISICGIDGQWEVWAFYEVEEDEPASTLYYNVWWPLGEKNNNAPDGESDIQAWINKQLERSEMNLGVNVTTSDQFLTVYTCGDNLDSSTAQSRLYFFLRQVEPASTKFVNGERQYSDVVLYTSEGTPISPEDLPAEE